MTKNGLSKVLVAGFIIILFSGFFPGKEDVYFQISKNIDLFGKVYKDITMNYVDKVNPQKFMQVGIKSMLNSLDPYTVFLDGDIKDDIDLITNGKYGGIGISIGIRGGNVTVIETMDGYSAQKQGIRIGDVIVQAGDEAISPKNIDDLSKLVKGKPGTMVHLKVLRNDEKDTLSFNLIREEIKVKSLTYYGFYPENSNNAYLKLTSFSRSAAEEVKSALKDLKSQKEIKSIIFDVRGNPGGLLDVAVDICDKFLPKDQLVVTTKGRNPDNDKSYYSVQEPLVGSARLVVLVNGGSASASEIFSGAMQDHDRGIILGTKSFGKGLVQTVTPLDYNTSLKITTAKYYTPSGRCIQKIDYADKNDILSEVDTVIKKSYLTDHKRTVFSAGGITPDTVVTEPTESAVEQDLLAKGIIFQFADHYYYLNPKINFDKINSDELFKEFEDYLTKNNYQFHSKAEKQVDDLMSEVKEKKLDGNLYASLGGIKKQFEKIGESALKMNKSEITNELKDELASRYLGNEGKISELLNNDIQFNTALKILSNRKLYNKILNDAN